MGGITCDVRFGAESRSDTVRLLTLRSDARACPPVLASQNLEGFTDFDIIEEERDLNTEGNIKESVHLS